MTGWIVKIFDAVVISFVKLFSIIGSFFIFTIQTIRYSFKRPFLIKDYFEQAVKLGVNSMFVVAITSLFTGMVLALQTGYALQSRISGTERFIGGIVALSFVRELGPVLTALMIAGRGGSAMAAEIATMKVTEQIDALITLSTNPIHYLVVPRFIAAITMFPVITIISDLIGLAGGFLVSQVELGLNPYNYIEYTRIFVGMGDIMNGIVKSLFFGMVITLVSCYNGFRCEGGAEGVGKSTTRAVVSSSISILILDYILTSIFAKSF